MRKQWIPGPLFRGLGIEANPDLKLHHVLANWLTKQNQMDVRGFFHGESNLARLMTIAIEGRQLEDVNFSEILEENNRRVQS